MIAAAILVTVAVAGCGGSSSEVKAPPLERAQGFADAFVRRLVTGRWDAIEEDVAAPITRETRNFQDSIHRDGIRTVRGQGTLRHDCPAAPTTSAGRDCFVYRLSGRQVVPIRGAVELEARYRLWVDYEDGRWQVVNYDYDLIPTG